MTAPREGHPRRARYWLHVPCPATGRALRVGWLGSRARGLAWLRAHAPRGWVTDRRTGLAHDIATSGRAA